MYVFLNISTGLTVNLPDVCIKYNLPKFAHAPPRKISDSVKHSVCRLDSMTACPLSVSENIISISLPMKYGTDIVIVDEIRSKPTAPKLEKILKVIKIKIKKYNDIKISKNIS